MAALPPPALSSAALLTALAALALSSDASFAGEAGTLALGAAGAGGFFAGAEEDFLTGAGAFLAGAAGFGAAFFTGEAAATALATPAAAAVRFEAGRLDGVGVAFLAGVEAFFDGVGAFFEGVEAFLAGDWREREREMLTKKRVKETEQEMRRR